MKKIRSAIIVGVLVVACIFLLSFVSSAGTELSLANGKNGVDISWQEAEAALNYEIRRISGDEEVTLGTVDAGVLSFCDESAVSGRKYIYTVRPILENGESGDIQKNEINYLAAPEITSLLNTPDGARLRWSAVRGAEKYRIYKRAVGEKWTVLTELDAGNREYFVQVSNGDRFSYAVTALSGKVKSAYKPTQFDIYLESPEITSVQNKADSVEISWTGNSLADGYIIYRSVDGGAWKKVMTVDGAKTVSAEDPRVSNNKTYQYRVRAFAKKSLGAYDPEGLGVHYLKAPAVSIVNTVNGLKISWTKTKGAEKYTLYKKTGSQKSWSVVGNTLKTSYTDKNTVNGKKYKYTVRAVCKDSRSFYRNGAAYPALSVVASVNAVNNASGIKISWKEMSSAEGYIVYRRTDTSSAWSRVGKVRSLSYTDRSVKNGVTYHYTVRQYSGSAKGAYDPDGIKIKRFVCSIAPKVKNSPKGSTVSWNSESGITLYTLFRKAEGDAEWKKVASFKAGKDKYSYSDGGMTYGKTNYYKLNVSGDGGESADSSIASVFGINPAGKCVALTYDDGPYTPVTTRILDVLKKYDSRATFFVVGSRVNTYSSSIKREAELGCEIANHTYNHTILTSCSVSTMQSEISRTDSVIKNITGKAPVIMRAPGGAVNSTVKNNIARPIILWSVDTLDWKSRNSSSVTSNIKNYVRDGSIVLMHDLYPSTAAATENVVPWLVQKGYQLVTVTELMNVKGISMKNGVQYNNAY